MVITGDGSERKHTRRTMAKLAMALSMFCMAWMHVVTSIPDGEARPGRSA